MANIKAAQKYIRKTLKRREHNRSIRSRLRTLAKRVRMAETPDDAKRFGIIYSAALDKAAKVGIIHRNKASRHKSRVASKIFAV